MIYIISDDLTGANDTGVQYTKQGFRTLVTVKPDKEFFKASAENYDVISMNTDTRSKLPEVAYEIVYDSVKMFDNMNKEYVYKKIDSIVRGNPGVELDAVMDAINAKAAIVATSFPEVGRKLINGKLELFNSKGESSIINVIDLFSKDMKREVSGISISIVKEGAYKIADAIRSREKEGFKVFIIDAETDEDLQSITEAARIMDIPPILCGSAGLAKQLSVYGRAKIRDSGMNNNEKVTLIMIGSRNDITSQQIRALEDSAGIPIVTILTEDIFNGNKDKLLKDIISQVISLLKSGCKLLAIVVDTLFDSFTINLKDSEQALIDSMNVAKTIGEIAKAICESTTVDNIISSGGDTSQQILLALEAKGIHLENEIIPGVPVGKVIGGITNGMTIVTKSGGFGKENCLIKIVEYLKDYHKKG
ncbi:hypothetical protein CLHOM_33540 [Clostridium homopropionicum DSM 5847]|uniref:D-threonate kinase n=1 Tax=Clostridium homopropionicum DSM 5847 TaxID=1121318 RepID=A0A0L6Z654_9CLOT|nr:four-carbon acid sugar kinase family protein [Clostridium homopropionicum]KOA18452.1 hypothetical protein CLHOM_33540 [Clostridium homopropionicum DSM 5847]SFF66545.1 Uncharacterized conserved protein YgbK, DUF1537 family [Clostridium homopropionicum]